MSSYAAFLRGINVGGKNMIPMADLRAMATDLGFDNVKTLLQSGNLTFQAAGSTAGLEAKLEDETQKRFGFSIDYCVRSADELNEVIAANPFPGEAKTDPSHLLVLFTKSSIEAANVDTLQNAIAGSEIVRAGNRCAYAVFPDGIGTSKLTMSTIDKHLKCRTTGRNWNTVLKLAAQVRPPEV